MPLLPVDPASLALPSPVVTADSLRNQYRAAVLAWDEAQPEPDRANRLFDRLHDLAKEMRQSEEGRTAIAGLLNDPVVAVRLVAATHALTWAPEVAEPVLQALEREPSLHAVCAKWTLRSHRAGTLNLDW
jgi:hypothetical protein